MHKQPSYVHVLAIFSLVLSVCGNARAGVFNPVTQTLENGLQIVVVENHRAPVVTHMLWVKAGAADEAEGASGVAHYLEHLMFKGTTKVANGEYSRRIARVGGNENAFTSADYTAYFATVAPEHLPLVMELESDRLFNLKITPELAVPELAVVMDERRQRVDNDPFGLFSQQMQAELFPAHPYGRPVIGWKEETEKLDVEAATAFYKKWYRPSHAVLIVSGDVEPQKVFALARQYYGPLPSAPAQTRRRVVDPPFTGHVTFEAEDARLNDVTGVWGVRVPSRRMDKELSYAFEILAEILAGTDGAVLSRRMIGQDKLVSTFDVSYEADVLDEATFSFTFLMAKGVSPEKAVTALHAHLRDLSTKPLPQAAIDAAKASLRRAAVLARDSVMGPAYAFGMALSTGQTVEDVESWPDRIAAVTPEKLQEALQKIINTRRIAGFMRPAQNGSVADKKAPRLPTVRGGPIQ